VYLRKIRKMVDEEDAWARNMDDWIIWEAEEEAARRPEPGD